MKTEVRVHRIVRNYTDMLQSCKTFTISNIRSYYHQFEEYIYPYTYLHRIYMDTRVLMNSNPELYVWCKYINHRAKTLYNEWAHSKSSIYLGKTYGSVTLPENKDYFDSDSVNLHSVLTYSPNLYKEQLKKEIYIHG